MDFAAALDDLVKNYTSGRGPSTPGATVNAPGSALDAATQARLAQMRAADRAAVEAARGAAVAPPGGAPAAAPPAASPPKTGFGARVASAVNPSLGQVGKVGGVAAKGMLALAPVLGLLSAASSSKADVQHVATMTDNPVTGQPLDYNSFGGRVGANILNFLQKTGDAATFGLAGRLGRVLGGGSFFDDETPAVVPAPKVSVSGGAGIPEGDLDTPPAAVAPAAVAQTAPPDAGGVVRRALGPAESFGGYIEGPNGRVELPSGTVQRFGVRRRGLAENINAARERHNALDERKVAAQETEATARRAAAGKTSAEEVIALSKVAAAQAYLKNNPGDLGGYVAMLSGKDPKETVGTVASPTGSTTLITRDRKGITVDQSGNMVERAIYRQPSEGEVAAMKANIKDPAYKASFIRHFGPDAYKTLVESR